MKRKDGKEYYVGAFPLLPLFRKTNYVLAIRLLAHRDGMGEGPKARAVNIGVPVLDTRFRAVLL